MLKTARDGKVWLVTQPDHAEVSGHLAAHWGNDEFARPGRFGAVPDPERLRAEVVFAVAEHDNGWWEWEAAPDLSGRDDFPAGLGEVLADPPQGMDRWRRGVSRFPAAPYANLLISLHAHWLYAARAVENPDPAFTHPLFWNAPPERLYAGRREEAGAFLAELEGLRRPWAEALRSDPATAAWVEPESLHPHARLLQLLDGLSLALCSDLIPAGSGVSRGFGEDEFELRDVPRRGWHDRATVRVAPAGERRVALTPYPFDRDPLPVPVVARVFDGAGERPGRYPAWWHAQGVELLEFRLTAGG